jgi:DNA-binding transcriptional LysR family regulator
MDRHHEMRVFSAVASDLSLAAAARQLSLSAPTVTRAMAALENRLGVHLLERSTRGVRLTEAGERFASDCRRLLEEVEKAEASASGLHAQPRGHLNLAMPLLFGQQLLMPILLDYLHAYPQVEIFAQYLDRFPNLHEDGVDVAVLVGALPDSSLFAQKVGYIRRVLCASPGYLSKHAAPQTPQELSSLETVHSLADARVPQWRFTGNGESINITLRPRLICANNQAAIAAACRGAGLTRCMSYQIHHLLASDALVRVLQAYEPPALPVHLVYREGRKAAARVRSFVDFTVSRLREHPALREADE